MAEKIKAADLENGNTLVYLKLQFMKEPTQENLLPLLWCLRDSVVKVPFIAEMSEEDKKRVMECAEGETFCNKDEVRLTADILKAQDDNRYFPIFSQDEQMPEDYRKKFTVIPITALDALKMAHGDETVSGLVLDGFTFPFVVPFELADYMASLPSRIEED